MPEREDRPPRCGVSSYPTHTPSGLVTLWSGCCFFLVVRGHGYRRTHPDTSTQMIEYWAGTGNLTREHINLGLRCSRFDVLYGEEHRCTSPSGLRLWLEELCQTSALSLIWMATQCSSFVPLCLAQSQRRPENGYRGDETRAFVRSGNRQTWVASLVFFLSWLLGNSLVLEQPLQSVMPLMQPLKLVLEFTDAKRTLTWLGQFAARFPKPLQLWHCHEVYRQHPNSALRARLSSLTTRQGRRYSGRSRQLKQSQEYTHEFAVAVAALTASALECG